MLPCVLRMVKPNELSPFLHFDLRLNHRIKTRMDERIEIKMALDIWSSKLKCCVIGWVFQFYCNANLYVLELNLRNINLFLTQSLYFEGYPQFSSNNPESDREISFHV